MMQIKDPIIVIYLITSGLAFWFTYRDNSIAYLVIGMVYGYMGMQRYFREGEF